MKLYGNALSCSLASHIAAREAAIDMDYEWVSLSTKRLDDGADYLAINPKGQVPALVLDDGRVLTEGVAILQYLAAQKPAAGLMPPAGGFEHAQAQEWLNFIATELHKKIFYALFNPLTPPEAKAFARSEAPKAFSVVDRHLAGRAFLVGEGFTVADAYLATALNWFGPAGFGIADWPNLAAYQARITQRPGVGAALADELQRFQARADQRPPLSMENAPA
jgi:glutathione S-transferase